MLESRGCDAAASDLATNIAAVQRFLRACTAEPLDEQDTRTALAWNMVVPPSVRGAMISREIDGSAEFAALSVPVLVSHGRDDTIVLPSMAEHVLDACRTAIPAWYEGVGHMPFWERAERFDRELAEFCARVHQSRRRSRSKRRAPAGGVRLARAGDPEAHEPDGAEEGDVEAESRAWGSRRTCWRRVLSELVGEKRQSVADRLGIDETHGLLLAGRAEEALAVPEHDREDDQPQLVDEVVLEQCASELITRRDLDFSVQLVLELGDLGDNIAL